VLKDKMGQRLVVKTEGDSVNNNVPELRNDDLVESRVTSANSHEGEDKMARDNKRPRKHYKHRMEIGDLV
jgi:hypothetical protein